MSKNKWKIDIYISKIGITKTFQVMTQDREQYQCKQMHPVL